MEINILGTDYSFEFAPDDVVATEMGGELGQYGGFCDGYQKKIVIADCDQLKDSATVKEILKAESVRHEIIHAFLNESGLRGNCEWSQNEELVDWIALQFPKIAKVFDRLGVL